MFDWTFISHYAPFFVSGAEMTLFISVFGIILAIVVGLVCAGIEIARIPVLRQVVRVYIELSRNTPLLVQLYFLYFGLPKLGLVWSAELCAIVGLGFLGGSYMAEAMRGGLETIPEVQRESAYVLGLSKWQTLSRVVIPQAISTSIHARPALAFQLNGLPVGYAGGNRDTQVLAVHGDHLLMCLGRIHQG